MRWCFQNPANVYADQVLNQLTGGGQAIVPYLWLYEVTSVLAREQKEGRLSAMEASDFIADLNRFNIQVDPESADYILTDVRHLAITHGLTGYDAAYLELAIRKRLPLATLDQELIKTCKTIGHPLL